MLLVCPGIVYRRDSIDRLHTGHAAPARPVADQRAIAALDAGDLKEMIEIVVRAALPGAEYRVEARVHPYTTDGLQIDVENGDEWVEIGECGLAGAHVLRGAGVAGTGLAMGLGLDRILMLRKGIADIRLLRADRPAHRGPDARPRACTGRCRTGPPVTRDLSIAVPDDDAAEELGDRVRAALGEHGRDRRWKSGRDDRLRDRRRADLPPSRASGSGLQPGQKNVLVRVVLRHPSRTLTREEANELRDDVYDALHCGSPSGGASCAQRQDSRRGSNVEVEDERVVAVADLVAAALERHRRRTGSRIRASGGDRRSAPSTVNGASQPNVIAPSVGDSNATAPSAAAYRGRARPRARNPANVSNVVVSPTCAIQMLSAPPSATRSNGLRQPVREHLRRVVRRASRVGAPRPQRDVAVALAPERPVARPARPRRTAPVGKYACV